MSHACHSLCLVVLTLSSLLHKQGLTITSSLKQALNASISPSYFSLFSSFALCKDPALQHREVHFIIHQKCCFENLLVFAVSPFHHLTATPTIAPRAQPFFFSNGLHRTSFVDSNDDQGSIPLSVGRNVTAIVWTTCQFSI